MSERIIRGAGKSYALLQQMSDVVSAAVKVADLTGQLPIEILDVVLRFQRETEAIREKRRTGKIDEASIERWYEDGTFDRQEAEDSIKAGVLQIIASQLVRQTLQEHAGESEMRDGINKAFEARHRRNNIGTLNKGRRPPRPSAKSENLSHR
jgi:hypothetical protein